MRHVVSCGARNAGPADPIAGSFRLATLASHPEAAGLISAVAPIAFSTVAYGTLPKNSRRSNGPLGLGREGLRVASCTLSHK